MSSTPPPNERAVAVFAKRPLPGKVKTRLAKSVGAEAAADLYWAFVRDLWSGLEAWAGAELFLFTDGDWAGFEGLAKAERRRHQAGGHLGRRMYECFQTLKKEQFKQLMIVGTDSPTLPVEYLQEGFSTLGSEDAAVLGPASDGGYYAVGCVAPRQGMFDQVAWSAETTLAETEEAFGRVGYHTSLLPEWWDVDKAEDLKKLRLDEDLGEHVKAWFAARG